MLTSETWIKRGDEHVETQVGDQVMMMSIEQNKYYALEASAQRIWVMLDRPRRVGDVLEQLTAEYDVEPDRCERDVLPFLGKLIENGLIVETDGASGS